VRVISAILYRFDISLEEVAMSLGANRFKTFMLITIPLIKPALISAAVFSFVVSFNNFTATMFIVTKQTTLPVEVFSYIRTENDPTVAAISSVFVVLTIILILLNRKRIGTQELVKRQSGL
jgi:putative spermidine/putrescine transport system permease protein